MFGNLLKTVSSAVSSKEAQNVIKQVTNTATTALQGTSFGQTSVGKAVTNSLTGVKAKDGDAISSLISTVFEFIKANLPFGGWGTSEEEENAQDTSLSQFQTYLAEPAEKPVYEAELQQLDKLGAVDLSRITREQWPTKDTFYFALLSINTYEKESYALGKQVVVDAINVAKIYKSKGYRVAYLCNESAKDFYKWVDFFVEKIKTEITIYFSGIATNVIVTNSSINASNAVVTTNNITQVLAFRNELKKPDGAGGSGATRIEAGSDMAGVGTNSISEDQIYDIVERVAKVGLRTVIITNVVNNASVFTVTSNAKVLTAANKGAAKHLLPPHQCVYVQNNSSSNTNQSAFDDKFAKNPNATFTQFKALFTSQNDAVDPNGGITIYANNAEMLTKPVITPIPTGEEELQIEEITPEMTGPGKVNTLPDPSKLTPAEIEGAEQRWAMFVAEMKKSPNYDTKYKSSLVKLDSLGCINLERLDRSQIPAIRIDRVIALFFCPYEDLDHTLDLGPVNDGLTMANLYLSKGYKVVYLMDATPKEFYSWMDWLLSNIRGEIVVYFSGHGTQTRDTTGKEADGMMELLVFYNDSKKTTKLPKIPAMSGITDMTVSDDVLHKLITLKDYPDTRVVLMSDCCHSGTMYNFDQQLNRTSQVPLNVVAVGAAKDNQTAKQTVLGGKESGVYTYSLETVVKANAKATFVDLEAYCQKNIKKYQDINVTTTNQKLLKEAIIKPTALSTDPTSRNYSPALLSEAQLKTRALTHKTAIPAQGVRVKRERPNIRLARVGRKSPQPAASASAAAPPPKTATTAARTSTTTTTTTTTTTKTVGSIVANARKRK